MTSTSASKLKINHAKLDWNESGTPVSNDFDDVYFSNHNGLEESRYVFISQNRLPERFLSHERNDFVVAETGFGTGLNFLALWKAFDDFLSQHPDANTQRLHFISFEKYPVKIEDLIKAHQSWLELNDYARELQKNYPAPTHGCQRIELANGRVILDLWFGDIHDSMPKIVNPESGIVDAWFLDGFAPSKNPDMWNQTLFDAMARLSRHNATLATFTAAGFVRRGLIDAGFNMSKAKGFGHKRDMLIGSIEKHMQPHIQDSYQMPCLAPEIKEIAIIGGGIASACVASQLIKRGFKVSLYCQEKVAHGASSNKQGALYPLIAEPEKALTEFFAPAFIYARRFYQSAFESGVNFRHAWCGVSQVGFNPKAQAKLDKMKLNGFTEAIISEQSAAELSKCAGVELPYQGMFYPQGGWLCPQEATTNLLIKLAQTGKLDLYEETKINDITWHSEENVWLLDCVDSNQEDNQYQAIAPALVIANGHQVHDFEQTKAIPISPVKGQVSHIPSTDKLAKLKTVLCYDGYLTPADPLDAHHCIGASHDRSNIDKAFDKQAQIENVEKLKACFSQDWAQDADSSQDISRQGIRATSRDHLPFVGAVADFHQLSDDYAALNPQYVRDKKQDMPKLSFYPNLYCIVGLGGRGLCSAPFAAEVLSDIITGEPLAISNHVLHALHPAKTWLRRIKKGRPLQASV